MNVAAISYWLFTPADLKEFGQSAVAATLSSSNILFWLNSGYFDAPAEQVPLLHTWSLAVEEQFYIVFPVLLVLIFRFARGRWSAFTVPIAAVSLALSIWTTRSNPSAAFYLAPTRAWELMLGAMLATGAFPAVTSRRLRDIKLDRQNAKYSSLAPHVCVPGQRARHRGLAVDGSVRGLRRNVVRPGDFSTVVVTASVDSL